MTDIKTSINRTSVFVRRKRRKSKKKIKMPKKSKIRGWRVQNEKWGYLGSGDATGCVVKGHGKKMAIFIIIHLIVV